MSETPRTDEFWTARLKGPAISQRHPNNTEWVAFARQLERELNAALSARPEEVLAALDWNRLASGDYRALDPEHQWVFDIVRDKWAKDALDRSNMNEGEQ